MADQVRHGHAVPQSLHFHEAGISRRLTADADKQQFMAGVVFEPRNALLPCVARIALYIHRSSRAVPFFSGQDDPELFPVCFKVVGGAQYGVIVIEKVIRNSGKHSS